MNLHIQNFPIVSVAALCVCVCASTVCENLWQAFSIPNRAYQCKRVWVRVGVCVCVCECGQVSIHRFSFIDRFSGMRNGVAWHFRLWNGCVVDGGCLSKSKMHTCSHRAK